MQQGMYITDINGIYVWDPYPSEGEKVEWVGPVTDGFAEGEGMLVWQKNGNVISVYEGTMRNGKCHGVGTYRFAEGDIYLGQWVDGLRQGYGTQMLKDGTRKEGYWLRDKLQKLTTGSYSSSRAYI